MDPSKIANVAAQIETMNVTSDNSAAAADKVEEGFNLRESSLPPSAPSTSTSLVVILPVLPSP